MISFTVLVIATSAVSGQSSYQKPSTYNREPDEPAVYNFNWAVKDDPTKNNYGQNEDRNEGKTSGSYFVSLPDGRLQKVSYSIDGLGGYKVRKLYYSFYALKLVDNTIRLVNQNLWFGFRNQIQLTQFETIRPLPRGICEPLKSGLFNPSDKTSPKWKKRLAISIKMSDSEDVIHQK